MLKLQNLSVLVLSTALHGGYVVDSHGFVDEVEVVAGGVSGVDLSDLANRVVEEVQVLGLRHVSQTNVKNQIRMTAGRKYDQLLIDADIKRLTALSFFDDIKVIINEGKKKNGVVIVYVVHEVEHLDLVAFTGNKAETDGFLAGLVVLKVG